MGWTADEDWTVSVDGLLEATALPPTAALTPAGAGRTVFAMVTGARPSADPRGRGEDATSLSQETR
ncbi:hypothetical protein PUR61_22165 [Streptomyces sp. BE20]|uniref:hypothetical protein n=1 Tax=Streptomyces sp. BE20 TaxID=3002525 RepID=UPI002E77B1EF|nr:hypothetical protein [Streptomyces sp. BE20]MEE1824864.1 hypothetical protein [Streptomyces sp. BE20]